MRIKILIFCFIALSGAAKPLFAQNFFAAIAEKNAEKIYETVESRKEALTEKSDAGKFLLHYALDEMAAENPHYRLMLVRYLLASGADPNVRDAAGLTPLMYAASFCAVEEMKYLLLFGAKADFRCEKSKNAYDYAAQSNCAEAYELLKNFTERNEKEGFLTVSELDISKNFFRTAPFWANELYLKKGISLPEILMRTAFEKKITPYAASDLLKEIGKKSSNYDDVFERYRQYDEFADGVENFPFRNFTKVKLYYRTRLLSEKTQKELYALRFDVPANIAEKEEPLVTFLWQDLKPHLNLPLVNLAESRNFHEIALFDPDGRDFSDIQTQEFLQLETELQKQFTAQNLRFAYTNEFGTKDYYLLSDARYEQCVCNSFLGEVRTEKLNLEKPRIFEGVALLEGGFVGEDISEDSTAAFLFNKLLTKDFPPSSFSSNFRIRVRSLIYLNDPMHHVFFPEKPKKDIRLIVEKALKKGKIKARNASGNALENLFEVMRVQTDEYNHKNLTINDLKIIARYDDWIFDSSGKLLKIKPSQIAFVLDAMQNPTGIEKTMIYFNSGEFLQMLRKAGGKAKCKKYNLRLKKEEKLNYADLFERHLFFEVIDFVGEMRKD